MGSLPARAQVVVIGGGAMGTSTLYHLVRAGCSDAVLLERDTLGSGSTGKSAGGIRAQFSDELNIRIGLECQRRFREFGTEPGAEIDFKQWGYLFLLREEHVPAFTASVELQQRLGVPSRLLTPEEAAEILPGIRTDDLAAATFCPTDGYATPEAVVQGYARAAVTGAATVVQGCTVLSIEVAGNAVTGVITNQGRIVTNEVVCVAGVWTKDLAAGVDIHVPVRPEKRHVHLTDRPDPLPRELPLTIDFATGFYFQREGDRILFGGREQTIDELARHALHRLPLLADLGVRPGWWGWYAMSPDHNAIVGEGIAAKPNGFRLATGFSGHGFQQSPVIGEHLAERALGLAPTVDLAGFSPDRFAAGTARPEANVV